MSEVHQISRLAFIQHPPAIEDWRRHIGNVRIRDGSLDELGCLKRTDTFIVKRKGNQLMRLIVKITEQSKKIVPAGTAFDRLS